MGKIVKKTLSIITVLLLVFYQSFFPLVTLAQEIVSGPLQTPVVTPGPTSEPIPSEAPQPSNEPAPGESPLPSESPEPIPIPKVDGNITFPIASESASQSSAQPIPSVWQTNADGSATTINNVVLNQTYTAPQNDKASVTFTKLPESPGTLTIKQIILSQEEKQDLGAFSDTAYEITSTMVDGTFTYDLTLPLPSEAKDKEVQVKAGENVDELDSAETIEPKEKTTDTIKITGLTHFTVFVVAGTISSGNSTPFNENNASVVVINEFVFNPEDNENDWIELYNRSNSTVDLTGWKLDDSTSTMTTLSGSLLPGGFLVFEVSNRLNTASSGDRIELKNAAGDLIDQVSYKDRSTTINGADDVGSVGEGESVGRTSDGVISGDIWTKYSDSTKGYNNSGDITFITVGEDYAYESIQDAIDNLESGGRIHVTSGDYEENLEIGNSLTLLGNPGDDSAGPADGTPTIIGDCEATISIMAGSVTVSGFNIVNDCVEDNIYIGSDLNNITITDNSISGGNNGVYINDSTNTTIQRNVIEENSYGIYLTGSVSGTQIVNNNINGNDGGISGGGGVSFDEFTILNNQIKSNEGYGIYFNGFSGSEEERSELIISNNTITGNSDTGVYLSGGDIDLDEGSITYAEVTISGNTISENSGDGIYADVIENSTFEVLNNTIGSYEDEENEFDGNSGNGIYICAEGECENSTITITNNNIVGNGNDGINFNEILENSEVTISEDNSILNNSGRGIYIWMVDETSTVEIDGNTISDNDEAGIYLDEEVQGVSIIDNTVSNNGGDDTGIVINQANGNSAHLNNISGNGVGVQNNDEENVFNAIENWWGSSSGPEGDGADSVSGNVSFKPWCLDTNCKNIFTQAPEGSLLRGTSFGVPPGSTFENAPSLSFLSDSLFNVAHTGGTSTITVPSGVVITRSDGSNLNVNNLAATAVPLVSLSGLGTGVVVDGALQWGIPNLGLEFKDANGNPQPISLSIFVGTSLNGQTLNVIRSTSGAGSWTSEGIVSPATCVVASGICAFQATKASFYATTRSAATVSTTSTSGSTQATTTPSGPFPAPTCNDTKPGSAPTLLSASGGSNSVTLRWSKAANPVTYYLATYGLSSGSQQYGNPNIGGADSTSYTVSNLSGGTTYYFKVRAGNGCAPGDFSNEVSATPGGGFIEGPAAGFAPGVLGAATQTDGNVGIGDEKITESVTGTTSGMEPGAALGEQTQTKPKDRNWFLIITVLTFGIGAGYFIFRKFLKS